MRKTLKKRVATKTLKQRLTKKTIEERVADLEKRFLRKPKDPTHTITLTILGHQYSNQDYTVAVPTGVTGVLVLAERPVPPSDTYHNSYYEILAYVGSGLGPTTVRLPEADDFVVMYLHRGMFTPKAELEHALDTGGSGGPPSSVGPDNP